MSIGSVPTSRGLISACLSLRLQVHSKEVRSDAWDEFTARYKPLIQSVLSKHQIQSCASVRNISAYELLSHVYEQFDHVHMDKLRHKGSFRKWLITVVRNAIISVARQDKPDEVLNDNHSAEADAEAIADIFMNDEVEECFNRVVDQFCKSLNSWQEDCVRIWAAKMRSEADLDSFAIEHLGEQKTYDAVSKRHSQKITDVYAFTKTMPVLIKQQFEAELEKLDRFEFPEAYTEHLNDEQSNGAIEKCVSTTKSTIHTPDCNDSGIG